METERLTIRTFELNDLPAIHRILDKAMGDGTHVDDAAARAERESWLRWSMLSQEWLPKMNQPAYGDRAVALRSTGALIGAVGFVPLLAPFDHILELSAGDRTGRHCTAEVGLFWVIVPAHQRRGYATEAAEALVQHAFGQLALERILAATEYDNVASQGVMRKLGMQVRRNPLPEPAWLQVVGILRNPDQASP